MIKFLKFVNSDAPWKSCQGILRSEKLLFDLEQCVRKNTLYISLHISLLYKLYYILYILYKYLTHIRLKVLSHSSFLIKETVLQITRPYKERLNNFLRMTLQTREAELNSGLLSPHPWLPVNIYCLQEGCLWETTEVLFPRSERELFQGSYSWFLLFVVVRVYEDTTNTDLVNTEPLLLEKYRAKFLWASVHNIFIIKWSIHNLVLFMLLLRHLI